MSLLKDATLESRWAYNETIRLAKEGVDWDAIPDRVADDADLVKNSTQRVVAKALCAMENYHEYDDFGLPNHTKDGAYPLRAIYELNTRVSSVRCVDTGSERTATKNGSNAGRASIRTTPTGVRASTLL